MLLAFILSAHRSTSGDPNADGSSSPSGPLPAVTVAAPPPPSDATQAACVQVFAKLPVQLGDLAPRRTDTDSSFVAAWGDPAVVLRCGVSRPAELAPDSAAFIINVDGVEWLPSQTKDANVFVSTDRAVYVEVSVPKRIVVQPLPTLADAVAVLPAVCLDQNLQGTVPTAKLCTRRP
ncbi:MAG: hypothetical protein JWN95_835 [Frankiales bacterium]|nr:hypothetical protein [Frankiales bacterium]